eukprot:5340783-Amphidinium_carterae.1
MVACCCHLRHLVTAPCCDMGQQVFRGDMYSSNRSNAVLGSTRTAFQSVPFTICGLYIVLSNATFPRNHNGLEVSSFAPR